MLSSPAYMDQVLSPIARTSGKMHFSEVEDFAEHMYINVPARLCQFKLTEL